MYITVNSFNIRSENFKFTFNFIFLLSLCFLRIIKNIDIVTKIGDVNIVIVTKIGDANIVIVIKIGDANIVIVTKIGDANNQ